jgi:flagellar basal body rod protein FlgG
MNFRGIVTSARSLSFLLRAQEVTANNLANANTDGFKADRLTAWLESGAASPIPVQRTDLQQGTLRDTGRPLDISLDGPGFFVAGTDQGERLVRGGSLHLDAASRLVNADGIPLLGETGPIVVSGSKIEVESDGTVMVDGTKAGQLRIVTVQDPSTLRKEGMGRFVASTPLIAAEAGTLVRQGSVEQANLDPLSSTIDLVSIQRAYSANLDALKAMDSVLATITSEVGKVP